MNPGATWQRRIVYTRASSSRAEVKRPLLTGSAIYDLIVEHCEVMGYSLEPETVDSIADCIASALRASKEGS
jgi:hypothetical protein